MGITLRWTGYNNRPAGESEQSGTEQGEVWGGCSNTINHKPFSVEAVVETTLSLRNVFTYVDSVIALEIMKMR